MAESARPWKFAPAENRHLELVSPLTWDEFVEGAEGLIALYGLAVRHAALSEQPLVLTEPNGGLVVPVLWGSAAPRRKATTVHETVLEDVFSALQHERACFPRGIEVFSAHLAGAANTTTQGKSHNRDVGRNLDMVSRAFGSFALGIASAAGEYQLLLYRARTACDKLNPGKSATLRAECQGVANGMAAGLVYFGQRRLVDACRKAAGPLPQRP